METLTITVHVIDSPIILAVLAVIAGVMIFKLAGYILQSLLP